MTPPTPKGQFHLTGILAPFVGLVLIVSGWLLARCDRPLDDNNRNVIEPIETNGN